MLFKLYFYQNFRKIFFLYYNAIEKTVKKSICGATRNKS